MYHLRNENTHFANIVLCYVHVNHSRYSGNVSRRAGFASGERMDGFCVFRGLGCSLVSLDSTRLRPIKLFESDTLQSNDSALELEEVVYNYTNGSLRLSDVMGTYCCSSCLFIVNEGRNCSTPSISIQILSCVADGLLVRCILHALQKGSLEAFRPESSSMKSLAMTLKFSCIVLNIDDHIVRMVPFVDVCSSWRDL